MPSPLVATRFGALPVLLTALLGAMIQGRSVHLNAAEPPLTSQQQQQFQERNRLARETRELKAEGKLPEALRAAEKMLAIERKVLGDVHDDVAASLQLIASIQAEREEFAATRKAWEKVLSIKQRLHGERHWQTADARLALEDCARLAKLPAGQRKQLAEANRLMRTVNISYQARKYREAVEEARKALQIRQAILGQTHSDTAMCLHWLGLLVQAQGDHAGARKHYEQALNIQRKVLGEQHPHTAVSLNNLGWLLREQGDYAGARKYNERALDIRRKVLGEQHPDTAYSLNNLGALSWAQGDYVGARKYHEQALDIRRKARGEQHPDTALSLHNLGALLHAQNDYTGARKYYEQALSIKRKVLGEQHPDTTSTLNNLGLLLHAQGNYAGARKYYEQALDILRKVLGEQNPDSAYSLNSLGVLLHDQGDYAGARKYLEQALAIRRKVHGEEHPDTATTLRNLGWLLHDQGDYAGARKYYEQALDISRRNLDLAAIAQSEREQLLMTAKLRFQLDTYLSLASDTTFPAEAAYAPVLAWKGAVFAQQRRQHECNRLLAKQADPSLARHLNELQQTARQLTHLTATFPEPKKQATWKEQLATLTERKEELERELSSRRSSAAGFRQIQARSRLSVAQLQAALPADTALVDFLEYAHRIPASGERKATTEQRLIAFVVCPGQPVRQVALGPIAPLRTALERWRTDLKRSRPVRDDADPATLLRAKVWQPLERHLGDARVVLLSPDGPLVRLPFAALPGRDPHKYLIEEYATAVVPVPQLLSEMLARKPTEAAEDPTLLLLGEVDYDADPGKVQEDILVRVAPRERSGQNAKWKALPATREEVVAIKDTFTKRFRKGRVTELREEEATTTALQQQAGKHHYLHLATHGFYADPKFRSALNVSSRGEMVLARSEVAGLHPGLLSGLVLAGANRPPAADQEDGILTALEVAELDLRGVDLAVLSACETALGQTKRGEGVLGLQRSFQVAGAGTVVASLWSVDDAATRALMVRFYEHLWHKKKPLGKLEALCQAQRGMLAEGFKRGMVREAPEGEEKSSRVPPYYWAAFVLSGDWR